MPATTTLQNFWEGPRRGQRDVAATDLYSQVGPFMPGSYRARIVKTITGVVSSWLHPSPGGSSAEGQNGQHSLSTPTHP